MKKTLTTIALLAIVLVANYYIDETPTNDAPVTQQPATGAVARAMAEQRSDVIVEDAGTLIKTLPDDNDGSRHQRLLLKMSSGTTVLIAHNIDLAPRVPNPRTGDTIAFKGEYEYNSKGGVVHWTHRDPAGRHPHGWLRHDNNIYQ